MPYKQVRNNGKDRKYRKISFQVKEAIFTKVFFKKAICTQTGIRKIWLSDSKTFILLKERHCYKRRGCP